MFQLITKNILSLESNRKERIKLKRNKKHKARNGLCQQNLLLLKVEKMQTHTTKKVLQMYF